MSVEEYCMIGILIYLQTILDLYLNNHLKQLSVPGGLEKNNPEITTKTKNENKVGKSSYKNCG